MGVALIEAEAWSVEEPFFELKYFGDFLMGPHFRIAGTWQLLKPV